MRALARSCAVVASTVVAAAIKPVEITVMNEWPMIMCHDAATTYLPGGVLHPVNNWAKTQPDGGTSGLLDCGARAFDWRPSLKDGSLVMHHGGVTVDHPMKDAMLEIINWAATKGTAVEDLVVIGVTDCDGGAPCDLAVQSLLNSLNITFITDCSKLKGLTVAEASKMGKMTMGGSILAINSCWSENYNPEVACSGYKDKEEYTCYTDSSSKGFPLQRMWDYIDNVTKLGPPSNGDMYTHQCIWQETTDSVVVGELHLSTLLQDEARSTLNALINDRIASGAFDSSRINMVEVNDVCDGGPALLKTLRGLN